MEKKDEYGIVLDFLEHGHASGKSLPLAQVIGEKHFNLLEVVLRKGKRASSGDRIYIGEGNRDIAKYIKGRISFDELTGNAKSELDYILEDLVEDNEERFVDFFNTSEPVTPRMHSLELLPGVGKKHMWKIIDEREKEDFKDFEDLEERVKLLPDPKKMIISRIEKELERDVKRYIFTSPPNTKKGR